MSQNNIVRGDIYWASLEPVKGSEQGGSRPVLIISNNLMNQTAPIVLIVPMTKVGDKAKAGYFNIAFETTSIKPSKEGILDLMKKGVNVQLLNGVLLCNQARSISKKRLLGKVGCFHDIRIIKRVEEALIHSFALDACEKCGIPFRPNGLICGNCKTIYKIKCTQCGTILPIRYNYCHNCGEGINV